MDGQGIPSVRLSLAVVAGMKKPNDHAEPTKVERYKKKETAVTNSHIVHILDCASLVLPVNYSC